MTLDEHTFLLGKLLVNFHSLEFSLRAYLANAPGAAPMGLPPGTDVYSQPVGTDIPENVITSYDSLSELLAKVNKKLEAQHLPELDRSLIEVRDALAHGRVSAPSAEPPLRLIKFERPRNGVARVAFNVVMTEEWFAQQRGRVHDAVMHVLAAAAA